MTPHPVRMTPEAALARLWALADALDELSAQESRAHQEGGGLAGILLLLSRQAEDCAVTLDPVVDPPTAATRRSL